MIDIDSAQPDQLRELRVGYVWNPLRRLEFRIAIDDPLLPGDLVEVLVVEDADDPAMVPPLPPILRDRDQFSHVIHLHGAVADERNYGTIWIGIFGSDGIGHRCAH